MFETAELGRAIDDDAFDSEEEPLRQALLIAQRGLRECGLSAIVLFAGVDGAGKGGTMNRLNEWMDPRWLRTEAYRQPTQAESDRPRLWRYWRDLPGKGRIGLFTSAWYHRPVMHSVYGTPKGFRESVPEMLEDVIGFEKMLADDGVVLLKFWMHLSKEQQKARLEELGNDPLESWRVSERDWENFNNYERFIEAAERVITRTNVPYAPWHIVEGADQNYREVRVGRTLLTALQDRLDRFDADGGVRVPVGARDNLALEESFERRGSIAVRAVPRPDPLVGQPTVFTDIEMPKVKRKLYKKRLSELQARLGKAQRRMTQENRSAVVVLEGPDAAGKGGAIRRMTSALDARWYNVIPIAAPTDEEKAHHYLWRFWRHMPRGGEICIFDRSWYGRVLVERVEGFASNDEWQRAYAEINHFERELVEHGVALRKFWVHITQEEQLERFEERENTPHKAWKLTDEDWRNREKWPYYEKAAHDMIAKTSVQRAPWVIVPANDKKHARLTVLENVVEALESLVDSSD